MKTNNLCDQPVEHSAVVVVVVRQTSTIAAEPSETSLFLSNRNEGEHFHFPRGL